MASAGVAGVAAGGNRVFVACHDRGEGVLSLGTIGDVAQLGERCVRNAQVRGSNPLVSSFSPSGHPMPRVAIFVPNAAGSIELRFDASVSMK